MGPDHDQRAVNQVRRAGLEAFPAATFLAVAGGDHGHAGVDDLGELGWGLDGVPWLGGGPDPRTTSTDPAATWPASTAGGRPHAPDFTCRWW